MQNTENRYRNSINALLGKVTHMSYSVMFREAASLGIHPGQVPLCAYLYLHSGCRQKEIAEALRIKPSTVSVSIDRMEKNGLVEKKADRQNARVMKIYATEKLAECYRTLGQVLGEREKILTGGFTEEEKELLRSYLKRMIGNLEQVQERESSGVCCGQEEL